MTSIDMSDFYRIAAQLEMEIQDTEGWRVTRQLRVLQASYKIFVGNYKALRYALDRYNEPDVALKLWDIKNRQHLEEFQHEVIRLFHNFLAAARSLVDHTRKYSRDFYRNHPFLEEYQTEIDKRFKQSDICRFVEDLRNYTLHVGLPSTHMVIEANNEGAPHIRSDVSLDLQSLLHSGRMSALSRQYIRGTGKTASLKEVVESYADLVADFHRWFYKEQLRIHADSLAELRKLMSALDEARMRAGIALE